MSKKSYVSSLLSLLLVISISLMNVHVVFADDGVPPTPTVDPTEPIVTETPTVEETPSGEEQAPAGEEAVTPSLFSQVPEDTTVVVLDENGAQLPLVSEEALDVILETDPMWCPAGILPGGVGCTTNFGTIALLISNMISNTNAYDQAGIIYFTATPGASFSLTTTSLGTSDFNQLKDNNLTLQGGWNGANGAGATFTGQSNFGSNSLTIGTSGNPWIGNIALNNFLFSGVSSTNAVTVYTTTGDIILNNVDVTQQSGDNYTANLDSGSGNITVQNGSSFDGNNSGNNQNRGFRAETNTGSITITGTSSSPITFTDANGCWTFFGFCLAPTLVNYNGATLSAPTVSLNYVSANNNDLNGIQITNANSVTLNHVNAINNGTNLILSPDSGDAGAGILVTGTGSTIVNVTGGTFNDNERYGVEVINGTITVTTSPTCSNNDLGCFNDNVPPVLTLPGNIVTEATSSSGAAVSYTASAVDNIAGTVPVTCSPLSGSIFAFGTKTVNCSATDLNGNASNGSFTVTVQDKTGPVIAPQTDISSSIQNAFGSKKLDYQLPSTTDAVDGAGTATCVPVPGSFFKLGDTLVTCTAIDSHGNSAIPVTFTIHVKLEVTSQVTTAIIPVTGGETIELDCNTQVLILGIKVIFYNLCEHQAILNGVDVNSLPGELPNGFSFVMGLDVSVLNQSQVVNPLPSGAGIEMDYPINGDKDQFAVLFWNNGQWVEVSQQINETDLAKALNNDSSDELYKLVSSENGMYKTLTTENTGIFILVKK